MLVVFVRSIILYIAVLIGLRIMGKGEVAEMNSFDLVITLLVADVASIPIENNNIPIVHGFSALIGLILMQTLISSLSLKNKRFATFLSGSPSILINKGKIDYKELKRERITIDELLEQLRVNGYFNIKDIQYAILETDGSLSVVPNPSYESPPTKSFKHLPLPIILDGRVIERSLDELNKDDNWLKNLLSSYNIENVKDVLVCILDEQDKIFMQKKEM